MRNGNNSSNLNSNDLGTEYKYLQAKEWNKDVPGTERRPEYINKNNNMKQGKTTESQVKSEIHERMTNIKKHRSPEFPEIGNVRVPEFSGNGKHRKIRSFQKSNNK